MQALLALSRKIDAFNTLVGRWLSWLIVVAVIISSANAIIRKLLDMSSNSFLELQWVLFSIVFLLCSPWTLLSNEHIRIDIINHTLPLKVRGWIDMIGHVFFLMPFAIILLWWSIPFFLVSYRQNEQSFSAGGLPQWPAKSLIMIACVLLIIQGISEIIKRAAMLAGTIPDSNAKSSAHAAELEAERLVMNITGDKP
ncbi:TRAP transporter small permease subunit [Rhodopseudomonas telluris]|uniref:TRAP transporter small permease protein n=1 Tax=Rhodopseudomonas telluris TaxID=644215 RepID=A0ABV6ESX2_9BRAD